MNPILSREIRGRFRDKRSFWLLLAVSGLLCIAATFIYANATSAVDYSGAYNRSLTTQAESRTGRELFRFLALGNMLAWLLIAPALTATGLAIERERGLLESLWLSPFRVTSQVLGRLGAALCFLFALQVAVLPIYGIALLLGGVSINDIGLAGLIIAIGALTGASFGLFCSARSYRGPSALGAAFFGVAVWGMAAYFYAQELIWFPGAGNFLWFPLNVNFFVTFTHPVALLWILLSPNDFAPRFAGPTTISSFDALTFGLIFQLLLSTFLLWSATRKASKPLPDMKWSQGNMRIKKWREAHEKAKIERQQQRERELASQKVAGALLYEVPVERFVRFKDPLLSREVRGRFRLRQGGVIISILRGLTFVIAVGFWLLIAYSALDTLTRNSAGMGLMMGLLGFGILAVGVMSSGALVREREAGTWEGLHLSLLSPREIVRSKWLSPIITFAYWSAPAWVLLPLCVNIESLGAVVIVVGTLSTVSAWGFYISSRAPHSAAATSWTLASLLVALAVLPALDQILGVGRGMAGLFPQAGRSTIAINYYHAWDETWRSIEPIWNSYHPVLSINHLFGIGADSKPLIVALNFSLNAILTAFLLLSVTRRLGRSE